MIRGKGKAWVLPLGAEPLGTDGRQLWYGDADGLGSVVSIGEVTGIGIAPDDLAAAVEGGEGEGTPRD